MTKEEVHELVEIFYQPPFKTFYVNSVDGENFVKPLGVFVSLGITTSPAALEKIRSILEGKYRSIIAEISSKRVGKDQYLNMLTNTTDPHQYPTTDFEGEVLSEEEAKEELEKIKSFMNPENALESLQEYAPRVSRLQDLINKLDQDNGWNEHLIQRDGDSYKLFHKLVNYMKDEDSGIEYRLGIYVSDN